MLPDLLKEGILLLICGTAVGRESARRKCYYSHHTNKFWDVLYKTGLTDKRLCPERYYELLEYGIGLVDLAKKKAGVDKELTKSDFDIDKFIQKIKQYRPKVVCFNGKTVAKIVLGKLFNKKNVEYGFQKEQIGDTLIFVAPSTSGNASRWFDIKYWQELANHIRNLRCSLSFLK